MNTLRFAFILPTLFVIFAFPTIAICDSTIGGISSEYIEACVLRCPPKENIDNLRYCAKQDFTGTETHLFKIYGTKSHETSCFEGKVHGLVKSWDFDGRLLKKGNFKYGKIDGKQYTYGEDASYEISNYVDGVREGPPVFFTLDGLLRQGNAAIDHNIWRNKVEISFNDGLKEGSETLFYNNKVSKISEYQKGVLHGTVTNYSIDRYSGETSHIVSSYKNGILHGISTSFHPNGKIENEITYSIGEKTEKARGWYDDGSKRWHVTSGIFTYWYRNGQIYITGPSKNGVAFGEWKVFSKTGELLSVGVFKDGVAWDGTFFISNEPRMSKAKNGKIRLWIHGDD